MLIGYTHGALTMALKFPKTTYYRSKSHLKNVASLPCQLCGIEGYTQAAHSNWAEHGKGRSIKASDEYVAALCQYCHYEIDQGSTLDKDGRRAHWDAAYRNTVKALVAKDLWPYDLPIPNLEAS